jgi:hypothetical protein
MAEVDIGNLVVGLVEGPGGQPRSIGLATDMRTITVREARDIPSFGESIVEELPGGYALREVSYASTPVETMISMFHKDEAGPLLLVVALKSHYENGRYLVVGDSLEPSEIDGRLVALARRETKQKETTSVVWEGNRLVGQLIAQRLTIQELRVLVREFSF